MRKDQPNFEGIGNERIATRDTCSAGGYEWTVAPWSDVTISSYQLMICTVSNIRQVCYIATYRISDEVGASEFFR